MTSYVVMAPPEFESLNGDPEITGRMQFVPDKFSPLAFLFSIPWILFHRMWLVLLGYLAVTLVIEIAALSLGGAAMGIAAFAIAILFGFEAQALRCWSLERKGWQMVGVAEGNGREEAEIRFFANRMNKEQTPITRDQQTTRPATNPIIPRIGSEQVVGLTLGPETRQ
ncbi:DUF2628 domain-containing protein [Labrenzia sp. R4_1]|jgi:hypothetical protein|uniref:DUF2628 domain-containing protein n=1 Tax=unclassified Labrenzia TaxID=2648686 RepID=UPI001ADD5165|nr:MULTISPECIES: DUF2628 domain-containing protein [unclassified Labrenzia]MBO9422039.1 DUF2628 domain-containing protein [Labrenzia sp. R4_2]MBO9427679.1 DUF2628 domain-containing protein [Labrenzia sp. R4_1]